MLKLARNLSCSLMLLAFPGPAGSRARSPSSRVHLFPGLRAGQTFAYQVGYRVVTQTKTESDVAAPMSPSGEQSDVNFLLRVKVLEVNADAGNALYHLRTRLGDLPPAGANGDTHPSGAAASPAAPGRKAPTVEFVLHQDGQVSAVTGLDALSAAERSAWQAWVSRFGVAAVFPTGGVKPGQKWKTEEPIPSSAIAQLGWEKKSHYVRNAPCNPLALTPQGDIVASNQASEACAIIFTRATLKQKSSPKDATPEDYKLHDLRTRGSARGTNEAVTYISLQTGLVVRATEDAKQAMDVIVAKSDDSNRVHYIIAASSHVEILLVAGADPERPQGD